MAWPVSGFYAVFWLGAQDISVPTSMGHSMPNRNCLPTHGTPWVPGMRESGGQVLRCCEAAGTRCKHQPYIWPFCTATTECHWGLGESQGWSSTGLPWEPACLLPTDHICCDFMLLPSTYRKQHSNIEFFIELILKLP